ncbi:MAG: gamma-glutamyltransferase [Gammaproteobacteria bacterium]|nr:gamma-glutamyltransferase [Gammaproteobacteria bacterium]NNJ51147.1 gamma-glutamyltransferase [Gammaproteobacteria bacterium]
MGRSFPNICFTVFFLFYSVSCLAQSPTENKYTQAAVASAHPLATEAGIAVMQQGGNAFDAAIAVTAALAVVEPYSSGIGGGGFYLLHQEENDRHVMIDARERAPLRAHRDLYLDERGEVIPGASITGASSAGIPGIPAALVHLADKYGNLKLADSLAPAIRHANDGFPVDAYYQRMAGFRLKDLQKNKAASELFLKQGEVPEIGHKIIQRDLARTLQAIASSGFSGFYENEIAWKMVRDVRKNGGIWTMKDLATYQVKERSPDVTIYKGMKLVSASLPSSGGLVLSEILQMLAEFDIEQLDEAQRVHLIVEAMRRAYRDRAQYMGDPDFIQVPIDYLVSEFHIKLLVDSISSSEATASTSLDPVVPPTGNGTDTTHFSVIDRQGNKVSATLSINYPFGSCFVARGTGVLLNDEMDDFVSKPGVPNVYGLVGSHANAIEPGKRMLSSMTPSIAETRDRIAIIGTPGGSRIITMVLLGVLDFYDDKDADQIVNAGRFHHQYMPDEISYEPGVFTDELIDELQQLGHKTRAMDYEYGNMQLIIIDKKTGDIDAASDARGVGSAEVLH